MKTKDHFKVGEHNIGWVSPSFLTNVPDGFSMGSVLGYTLTKESGSVSDTSQCTLGDIIATLDAATPEMKDGWGNFFLCGSVLVRVLWGDDRREWDVSDWSPDGAVFAGRRVFSGNLKLAPSAPDTLTLESLAARLKKLEALVNPELL